MTDPNEPCAPAGDGSRPPTYGLTKREYFAALNAAVIHNRVNSFCSKETQQDIACEAVEMADALISELNKEPA